MSRAARLLWLTAPLWLAGCDLLGIEGASAVAARREAEGKAIGGACRHAGRAIEDCFALNRRAEKAAMFAGWREMNDYMVENKIDVVRPTGSSEADVAAHDEPEAQPPSRSPRKDG
ncbi:MAG: hypothetical protein OEW22_01235 [Rubrivivax sp.]|nr:hypothetical protein [Rubrivivax sp.]